MTEPEVVEVLRICMNKKSQRQWAEDHGIAKSYVWDVLAGKSPPGPKILDALGIEKLETEYRWKGKR